MNSRHKPFRIVGAYAAQPDAVAERRSYLEAVLSLPGVDGLEISWGAPGWDEDFPILADLFERGAGQGQHVLTLIGAAASAAVKDPTVGLASTDAVGRARAVELVAAAHRAVAGFIERGQSVLAIEVHAFPSLPAAGAGEGGRALEGSLREIASWDWGGTALVVEHCDARPTAGPWQKGLLPLDVEIAAVTAAAAEATTPLGMAVNWGRSAIEERDATAPERHARHLRSAGLLRGVMFSGATGRDGAYGPAWSDVHPPLREQVGESVMERGHVAATLDAAGPDLLYEGVKVAVRPRQAGTADRIALIRGTLDALDAARST
ncbi:DUF4862 family protein (plasmid) [Azospirillum brasilense]|uniref:DUF4862 family protein n=1 Tax=Azospirillum brasilense TaxID=192 RepID=A0A4D8RJ52_AZOBR|nr:DUF4862 family protein [Azospirillum brasilense]QCO19429.1 DUF4862 family protein [Azospirillum brasilense]